jgi:hypothetical protein
MIENEIRSAARYSYLALTKPRWWFEFLRGGRAGLLKKMVADSVEIVRREPILPVAEALSLAPSTALGKMGAHQEYLYRLVRASKPKVVVETGVYRGVSSAFILAALCDNDFGRLFSIDLPAGRYVIPGTDQVDSSPLFRKEQIGYAVPTEVRTRWTLRLGDVRSELPSLLSEQPRVDMFYHDSEHTYEVMNWEFAQVFPHIPQGGLLTSDDANWNTAFPDFCRDHELSDSVTILNRFGVAVVDRKEL